jgi:hypothetical protein
MLCSSLTLCHTLSTMSSLQSSGGQPYILLQVRTSHAVPKFRVSQLVVSFRYLG